MNSFDYEYTFYILLKDIWTIHNPFLEYNLDTISILRQTTKQFNKFFQKFPTKLFIDKVLFMAGHPDRAIDPHYICCWKVTAYVTKYCWTVLNYRGQYREWFDTYKLYQIPNILSVILAAWKHDIHNSGMRPTWQNYWEKLPENLILPMTFSYKDENLSDALIGQIFSEILYFRINAFFISLHRIDFEQDMGMAVIEHNKRINTWEKMLRRRPADHIVKTWIKVEKLAAQKDFTMAANPIRYANFVSDLQRTIK